MQVYGLLYFYLTYIQRIAAILCKTLPTEN